MRAGTCPSPAAAHSSRLGSAAAQLTSRSYSGCTVQCGSANHTGRRDMETCFQVKARRLTNPAARLHAWVLDLTGCSNMGEVLLHDSR
jgi:hypothetical protein